MNAEAYLGQFTHLGVNKNAKQWTAVANPDRDLTGLRKPVRSANHQDIS
jgi:hypothetical protein